VHHERTSLEAQEAAPAIGSTTIGPFGQETVQGPASPCEISVVWWNAGSTVPAVS
jgi:hypothetical protein